MDSSGALLPFAQGGALIRSPTYFPMANGGTALAGEAGQEAIFPLARDSRGRLGLVGGGGGGTNITVNITTQGSSGNAAADAKAAQQMGKLVRAELERMMTDKMRDQMRPGGMFNGGGQPVYS
jgi:phage-related minor tail protein